MSVVERNQRINTLVLDAGPIITQSASSLLQYADKYYTTPGVYNELKDEHVRNQLVLWGDNLVVRQPKPESINFVIKFARMTGDSTVLSQNDLHIIALAYELECELNNGDWRLRKYPGEKRQIKSSKVNSNEESKAKPVEQKESEVKEEVKEKEEEEEEGWSVIPTNESSVKQSINKAIPQTEEPAVGSHEDGEKPVASKKPRRRGGKKNKKKPAQVSIENEETEQSEQQEDKVEQAVEQVETKIEETKKPTANEDELNEEYSEDEDDGEWITEENLVEEMIKDRSQDIEEAKNDGDKLSKVKVALSTGDFACQNVALQIGINLLNSMTGLQIKRVRNYMLRCHACFRLVSIPKDGTPKHFCPSCGGATLMRCAVSINSQTGKITPHLKANFEWHTRGDKYSLSSPLSKASTKRAGNAGFVHSGKTGVQEIFLREDQKEYQQAIKNSKWQARQNEKLLQDWVGGGSAENVISPFVTGNHSESFKNPGVKVGKGRYVNSSRRRK